MKNLFQGIPENLPDEVFEELCSGQQVKIERIVSRGHTTPQGEWYDQEWDEWVVLLSGTAQLKFEDRSELVAMSPGDYLHIAAHQRHRVEWTDPDRDCVWLAIHFKV
ncbi:cupin domain-containing protein [Endozoicomonas arenosclerae]|uniref:cupin domain-containing protein n=1 Tax=Endozoicomonas arenosclerae TaxID=1633495 RepID=UPI000785C96A|nr:cupin domain-containing protein [Endozoicomonas arenosclerae]